MAVKRKAISDVFPGQDVSTTGIKRISLGWGSWERYHQHGQDLARKGKYQEAIQILSEALLQKDADTVKIMDSRSAVYCKMALYEKALSDARHMIRAANKDERGYLRAGRALLLAEKPQKAVEVYEYALKTLGEQHLQKELIAKVHSKLVARMSSQQRDPILSLNHDCLLQIFQYLPFRTIVSLTRVSKAWRVYLKDQPVLWSDISFQGPKLASPDAVQACIHNSQGRVRRLQLHNVKDPLNAAQQASRCPRLEHIDIDGKLTEYHIFNLFHWKSTLKTLILSEKIPLCAHMLWTMLELPNLERVEIYQLQIVRDNPEADVPTLPNLQKLALGIKSRTNFRFPLLFQPFWHPRAITDAETVDDLSRFDRIPNLRELSLAGRDGEQPRMRTKICMSDVCHPKLRLLTLSKLMLIGAWTCPETMEHLHITKCHINLIPSMPPPTPVSLPRLKSLILQGIDYVEFRIWEILQSCSESLETLEIFDCPQARPADLVPTNEDGFKNLKKLILYGLDFQGLENSTILTMLASMPLLEELQIPYTKVTGTLIRKIVESESLSHVKFINLKGCEHVSVEAVEYGRANGLRIKRC